MYKVKKIKMKIMKKMKMNNLNKSKLMLQIKQK